MRVNDLDLMRFFAALAVVLYHYVSWFSIDHPKNSIFLDNLELVTQFGFLGVPLFFMISGFVILASAMHRSEIGFVISRITRLYPVYWLSVSITALTLYFFTENNELISLGNYLVNLSMLQSFVGFQNIDIVYWTLAKELQFYFCIFVLISFGILKNVKIWILIWLFITMTFMLFQQPFFMGWFISPEYSAFFIAGVCFYMIRCGIDKTFYQWCAIASLILSGASIYQQSIDFLSNYNSLEQWISVIIVALFYLVFWLVAIRKFNLKSSIYITVLGALTYPLYLIHNQIGKIILDSLLKALGPEIAVLSVTLLMIAAAFLIYVLFEKKVAPLFKRALMKSLNKLGLKENSQ